MEKLTEILEKYNIKMSAIINESDKVETESDFKEYALTVLKKAFGEKFDEDKANEMIDGIISKVDGDWGEAVGRLKASLN